MSQIFFVIVTLSDLPIPKAFLLERGGGGGGGRGKREKGKEGIDREGGSLLYT